MSEWLIEKMRGHIDSLLAERDALRKQLDEARELLGKTAPYVGTRLLYEIDAWLEAHKP